MGRRQFLKRATASGWKRLVAIAGHLGALAVLLVAIGVPFSFALVLERWLYAPFALLLVWILLFGEGAFRLWNDERSSRATAEARLRQLDTVEAKRAFIDQALDEAAVLRTDINQFLIGADNEPNTDYDYEWDRICTDLVHWETEVRMTFQRDFPDRADRFFDSEDDLLEEGERAGQADTADQMLRYLERRETRLRQIRKDRL